MATCLPRPLCVWIIAHQARRRFKKSPKKDPGWCDVWYLTVYCKVRKRPLPARSGAILRFQTTTIGSRQSGKRIWGHVVVLSSRSNRSERISTCLKENCGSMHRISRSQKSQDTPRQSCRFGSLVRTLCGSFKGLMVFGCPNWMKQSSNLKPIVRESSVSSISST